MRHKKRWLYLILSLAALLMTACRNQAVAAKVVAPVVIPVESARPGEVDNGRLEFVPDGFEVATQPKVWIGLLRFELYDPIHLLAEKQELVSIVVRESQG